jgi:hypothetical protein
MSLLDLLGAAPDNEETQPDWRQSVADCLEGEHDACLWVDATASALPKNFVGPATKMSAGAYAATAAKLGTTEPVVRAVTAVEALGSGFLPSGRPKILFEAHKFSAFTGGKYDSSHPNISSRKWNKALYGAGGEHQYARLAEALKLNEEAALKSASWGAFQILGSNFKSAGFPSVHAFVYAACQSEDEQLMGFASFVLSNSAMHTALIKRDWGTFARLYNGSGYAANAYDKKLASAYSKAGGR